MDDNPSLTDRINNLALTIKGLFDSSPDFICLCEVGNPVLGMEIVNRLTTSEYQTIWSDSGRKNQGLQILFRTGCATATAIVSDRFAARGQQRPRWMAVQFSLSIGSRMKFWLINNHWRSSYMGENASAADRRRSSMELGLLFRGYPSFPNKQAIATFPDSRIFVPYTEDREMESTPIIDATDPVIIVGDFNCEPWDEPFRLPDRKEFWSTTFNPNTNFEALNGIVFYNPLVKRPGIFWTFDKKFLWDQIIVSPSLMKEGHVRLKEDSIRLFEPISEATDHCALGAIFEC